MAASAEKNGRRGNTKWNLCVLRPLQRAVRAVTSAIAAKSVAYKEWEELSAPLSDHVKRWAAALQQKPESCRHDETDGKCMEQMIPFG